MSVELWENVLVSVVDTESAALLPSIVKSGGKRMNKQIVAEAGEAEEFKLGDVVQITNEGHHWFPAFITITETKPFGCMGYMISVTSNKIEDRNNPAYIRLCFSDFEFIGRAVVIVGMEEGK